MEPSAAVLQHISRRLQTHELSRAEVADAEAHFRLIPVGVDVQAGSACLMYDSKIGRLFSKAAASPPANQPAPRAGDPIGPHCFARRSVLNMDGHAAILSDTGSVYMLDRQHRELCGWLGPQEEPAKPTLWSMLFDSDPVKTLIIQDLCWLGSERVMASTSCGHFYIVSRREHGQTPVVCHPPVNVKGMHEYVRCMTCIEGEPKVVVVGDNGAAQHAETSHQLAHALSLSIWEMSNPNAPVLNALVTNQQASLRAAHVVTEAREGWHVEACSTHVAVTCPSATGPFTRVLVYAVQESEQGAPAVLLPMLTLEDSLMKCASNATWWAPGMLAYAAPFPGMHFLKVLDVSTGQCIILADSCWLLPGKHLEISSMNPVVDLGDNNVALYAVCSMAAAASSQLLSRGICNRTFHNLLCDSRLLIVHHRSSSANGLCDGFSMRSYFGDFPIFHVFHSSSAVAVIIDMVLLLLSASIGGLLVCHYDVYAYPGNNVSCPDQGTHQHDQRPKVLMVSAGTRIVCGQTSAGMERPLYVWSPCPQQAPFDRAAGSPVIMRKWVLYGIQPLVPVVDQPQFDGLSEATPQRIPSLLTGVLSWAARSWKWPASLWAHATAVATAVVTAGDISDSADDTQAGSVEEEESCHALVRGSDSGFPPSHAVASDMLQQSISSSSSVDRVISHDEPGDLAGIAAAHAEAVAPPKTPLTPQRRFAWSGRFTEAFRPAANTDEAEPTVSITRSGDILVNPEQHLQRASTWPKASSTSPALPPARAAGLSKPDLAISGDGKIILATSMPQDYLTLNLTSSQAAGNMAETSQAASHQQFHKTYTVKAGHVGIEEVKQPYSPEAMGAESPRIAAVQSHSLQLQEEGEEKPQWKVKADAQGLKLQQQKDKTVRRRKAAKKCMKPLILFAALICVIVASLGLLLPAANSCSITTAWYVPSTGVSSAVHHSFHSAAVKTLTSMKSSRISAVPGLLAGALADHLPGLTPGMPVLDPTLAEDFAETGGIPVKVSEAAALEPQRNRLLARLVAAFDWVPCMIPGLSDAALAVISLQPKTSTSTTDSCSADSNQCSQQEPPHLINGPEDLETASGSSGRQPTALASLVPGMQSVLPGVQGISPRVPGSISISSTSSWMPKWPALVPGGAKISSEGDSEGKEAPAGWQQHAIPKSVILARLTAAFDWVPLMTPGMPYAALIVTPTKPEEGASDDRTMMKDLSDAAAMCPSKQTPVQRALGPDVPKIAVGPPGRQPTASAVASLIPGMQSVLLGVRDITPDVPGFISISSILSHMPKWPALVPGVDNTGSEGEEAPAGWEQHVVPKGSFFSFCQLVQLPTAEPPTPTYTESLPGRDSLQRSPVDLGDVDLATQCVDSTLLSLDSSAGHLEDNTVPDPTIVLNTAQQTEQAPDTLAGTHDLKDHYKQDVKGRTQKSHVNEVFQTLAHYGLMMAFV